jgi:hypothetical protein
MHASIAAIASYAAASNAVSDDRNLVPLLLLLLRRETARVCCSVTRISLQFVI